MSSERRARGLPVAPWGMLSRALVIVWLAVSAGCAGETRRTDPVGQEGDGGLEDARGRGRCCGDAGAPPGDADTVATDAGTEPGDPDAGALDGGPTDAGASDAGLPDGGPPDAGPPDAGPMCASGREWCGGRCIDVTSDIANCGGCGIACGPYQTCSGGACADLPYGLTGRAASTTCAIGATFPPTLDATGCYSDLATRTPAAGLVEYGVSSLLWADGTGKRRFIMVPPGTTIGYTDDGVWSLPVGTIVIKEFQLETRRGDPSSAIMLESRFFVRRASGWEGTTYKWRADQTNADRYWGGRDTYTVTETDGTTSAYTHWFPSNDECNFCHNAASGVAIGLRTLQMNRDFTYGGITDNQLRALENAGYFGAPLPAPPSALPTMPDPLDTTAPLAERARSYLQGNCAHCHRPGGPTMRAMDLRYMTPFAMTNTCDVVPQGDDFDIAGARIIAPGDPARSIMHVRVTRRGYGQMPIVGSLEIDPDGAAVLRSWIGSLTTCP